MATRSNNVQAFRFPRQYWTREQAKAWLKRTGKQPIRIDTTIGEFRARMRQPSEFAHFITKHGRAAGKPIRLIVGFRRNWR